MKYTFNKLKLLVLAAGIVFIGFAFTWFKFFQTVPPDQTLEDQAKTSEAPKQKFKVNLSVDYGGGKSTSYDETEISEGDTAYSLLVKKMAETGSEVKTKSYDFGIMVESINNVSGTSSYFWAYSVNGQTGSVAADKYVLNNGDRVEWKFTPINN